MKTPFKRTIELEEYVPEITRNILDFKYLYAAEEKILDHLTGKADQVAHSFFVSLLDEESVKLWENVFLVNNSDLPLENRKKEIIKLLRGFQKLSTGRIEKIVLDYTSYLAHCAFVAEKSEIQISFIEVGKPPGIESLINYLDVLAPAHLNVVLIELYRTHEELVAFTHLYLEKYTHEELFSKRNI